MQGTCPKCDTPVTRVTIGSVVATVIGGQDRNAISYSCPSCNVVLSVQIDPLLVRTEIVSQILEGLGKK